MPGGGEDRCPQQEEVEESRVIFSEANRNSLLLLYGIQDSNSFSHLQVLLGRFANLRSVYFRTSRDVGLRHQILYYQHHLCLILKQGFSGDFRVFPIVTPIYALFNIHCRV